MPMTAAKKMAHSNRVIAALESYYTVKLFERKQASQCGNSDV
jgi:hypothetical protein